MPPFHLILLATLFVIGSSQDSNLKLNVSISMLIQGDIGLGTLMFQEKLSDDKREFNKNERGEENMQHPEGRFVRDTVEEEPLLPPAPEEHKPPPVHQEPIHRHYQPPTAHQEPLHRDHQPPPAHQEPLHRDHQPPPARRSPGHEESVQDQVLREKEHIRDARIFGGNNVKQKKGSEFSCKVLILGAGMAGITAAKTLKNLGVQDIMIVEGSGRIGGRVKDEQFGGVNVEVGANWVHFSNMDVDTINPVEEAVKKAGLNTVSDDYGDVIYRYKGKNVTDEAMEAQERFSKVIEEAVHVGERKIQNHEPDVNFRVALALQDWRPVTPIENAVEFFNFDFEFADEPGDTGLKDNFKIFAHHGKDDMFVADKRGYKKIIFDMADEGGIKKHKNLFFWEYVTDIHYMENGDKKVKVETKNSKDGTINTYRAEFVICTFSIGVLESDLVKFHPKLPAWKEETIYMYKMARYIKIFVKFPDDIEAFWDDNHYIFYVDPTTRGRYQLWQNLEARGKYFPRGTNIMLVTVLGNNWERVKHLSKEEIMSELYTVLRDMYGDRAVPPEDILVPDWHNNPLFFGAYSNWPIGISKTTYQNLDAPVGRLYMAGEACSPNYSGYLHGAMESGELTARNLYKCMEEGDCEQVPPYGYGYNQTECVVHR